MTQGLATLAIYSEISCNTNYLYTDRQPGKQSIVIKNDASLAVLKSEGGKATGVIRSEGGTATSVIRSEGGTATRVIRSEGGTATKELNYEDSQIDSKTSKTINHKRLRSSTGGLNGNITGVSYKWYASVAGLCDRWIVYTKSRKQLLHRKYLLYETGCIIKKNLKNGTVT